jgi:hypothetical protein
MPLAFVDESSSSGDSGYLVLAGYCAAERTWHRFWNDWQSVLDEDPTVRYFKMYEAAALQGEFLRFSPDQRNVRLNRFIDVILAHDLQEVSIAAPEIYFREILLPILPSGHAHPYYFALVGIVTAVEAVSRHFGSIEPVDFIFDKQCGMEDKAVRMFLRLKRSLPNRHLGRIAFRDDREMLPLQAADLIAWQMRTFKSSAEPLRAELRRLHSGPRRDFRKTLTRADFRIMAAAIQENLPRLREDFGVERIDKFLSGLDKRRRFGALASARKAEKKRARRASGGSTSKR